MEYDGLPYFSVGGDKSERRNQIIEKFANLEPGSRTSYFIVANLSCGNRIMISTPGQLNKGMDFRVNYEGSKWITSGGRKRDYPSHDDITNDIFEKISAAEHEDVVMLMRAIESVYNCEEPAYYECFDDGISVEALLSLIEWLFMEQDLTYWSFSGRDMLKEKIDEHFDVYV